MYKAFELEIKGHAGNIKNSFYAQEHRSGKLAIIFPGFKYTCSMPLLYYPTLLLLDSGYDALLVKLGYNANKAFAAARDKEQTEWIKDDATASANAALAYTRYNHLIIVGKSIGTISAAFVLESCNTPKDTATVWITPLLNETKTFEAMKRLSNGRSVLAIGTADQIFDKNKVEELKNSGMHTIIVKNADHSMIIKGNVPGSIHALENILQELKCIVE